jgi:hypothetical protein
MISRSNECLVTQIWKESTYAEGSDDNSDDLFLDCILSRIDEQGDNVVFPTLSVRSMETNTTFSLLTH